MQEIDCFEDSHHVPRRTRVAVTVVVIAVLSAALQSDPSPSKWDPAQGHLQTERVLQHKFSLPQKDMLRMQIGTFMSMVQWLECHGSLVPGRNISTREAALIFFWIVVRGHPVRDTAFDFGHSTETIHRSVCPSRHAWF